MNVKNNLENHKNFVGIKMNEIKDEIGKRPID